ncbi:hypothetical protein MNBD_NITROSPINAE02-1222 [hydrothermal vent metagenome]|uniref:Major facilitator superfamily (MFS) profile domain-containing protein n=1 Tax=hydrothermal vent metagenome TaxID=652676 RepID=A0A3B1BWI8_9ZZZZ
MTHETRIVTLTSSAHFFTHMNMLIFPAIVWPFSKDMGIPLGDTFAIGFFMYLFYGALALPAGYIADRWSKIGILKICLGGIGLSSIASGFSGGVASFTIALAFLGLFCGLYHPAGLGLIADEIAGQGRAHGTNGVFGALGIASAPFVAGLTLLVFDWRAVYFVVGGGALAGLGLFYLIRVEERYRRSYKQIKNGDSSVNGAWKQFAVLCVAMTLAGFIYRANMTAIPAYFEIRMESILESLTRFAPGSLEHALSGIAALLVSTIFLFSLLGQIAGGRLADRIDLRRAFLIYQLAGLPMVLGMAVFHGVWLYVAAAGFAFFTLGIQPIENSLVSKFMPKGLTSTGYGIKFTLTFGLGSLAVYQVAIMEKSYGLEWLYIALACETVILIMATLSLIYVSRETKLVANFTRDG